MHVVAHLKGHYDRAPLPAGITPTPEDLASGKAMVSRDGQGHTMRVRRERVTQNFTSIPELQIIRHMLAVAMPVAPRRMIARGQMISRRQAVSEVVRQVYVDQFEVSDVLGFEVHDHSGPDEALLRQEAAAHTDADHTCGRTGRPRLTKDQLEQLVKLYVEPADQTAHADHLHAEFGVTKAVAS